MHAESIDRAEVITLAIKASIPRDSLFRNELKRRIESSDSYFKVKKNIKHNRMQLRIDTLKHLLATGPIYLSVADSLSYVEPDYLKKLQKADFNPNSLYKKVEDWGFELSSVKKSNLFNIDECLPIAGYKIFLKNKPQKIKDSLFFAGTIQISQVFFNEQKTRAFISTYFYCGSLCAAQYDVFIEKINGKWILVTKVTGVVS